MAKKEISRGPESKREPEASKMHHDKMSKKEHEKVMGKKKEMKKPMKKGY